MANNPDAPYGSEENPNIGTNPPQYEDPDLQWIYDMILEGTGGPEGMGGILDTVRGIQPTPFLERLPWGQEQIGQFIQNRLTGKGVKKRADKYTQEVLGSVNRTATKANKQFQASTAATGGRGSSSEAAKMAQGKIALAGARGGARQKGMEYEDYLREKSFQQGMGALGAYQGAARGDWSDALSGGQLLLSSLGPELQVGAQDTAALFELAKSIFGENLTEQQFNQWLYERNQANAERSSSVNTQWGGFNLG